MSKPRTVKTLASAIAAFFQKQLTETEVSAVIAALVTDGFITVTDGKVEYAPAN